MKSLMNLRQMILDFLLTNAPLLLTILFAVLLIKIAQTSQFKGWIGEKLVSYFLRHRLEPETYHTLDNFTLPTDDGTTQIDHIIVSPYGIFVLETKNWKGWIFGSEKQSQWTVQIYRSKNGVQNPLRQNYKHLKTLATNLEMPSNHFHSLIVFVGDEIFKTEMPESVVHGARRAIKFIRSKTEILLSEEQVQDVIEAIDSNRLANTRQTRREHIQHVEEIKSQKEDESCCPKCGGEMVLKTVSRGARKGNQFWGCQSFPKCRGTRTVTS